MSKINFRNIMIFISHHMYFDPIWTMVNFKIEFIPFKAYFGPITVNMGHYSGNLPTFAYLGPKHSLNEINSICKVCHRNNWVKIHRMRYNKAVPLPNAYSAYAFGWWLAHSDWYPNPVSESLIYGVTWKGISLNWLLCMWM